MPKKYNTILEAFNLKEHLNIEGTEFIGNRNNYDVYRMLSYNACQEFVDDSNRQAGPVWVQNENTFNSHIDDTHRLYFITETDSNIVIAGIIKDNTSSSTVEFRNNDVTELEARINALLENKDNRAILDIRYREIPFDLIPGLTIDWVELQHELEVENNDEEELENEEELQNEGEPQNEEEWEEDDEDDWDEEDAEEEVISSEEDNTQNNIEQSTNETNDSSLFIYKIVGNEVHIYGTRYDYNRFKDTNTKVRDGQTWFFIPNEIENKPVTKIMPYAFYNFDFENTNVIFPKTIKEIRPFAFVTSINTYRTFIYVYQKTKYYSNSFIASFNDGWRKATTDNVTDYTDYWLSLFN